MTEFSLVPQSLKASSSGLIHLGCHFKKDTGPNMPDPNTIQWPSIHAFPKHVCGVVDHYLNQCGLAASAIQMTYRHKVSKIADETAMLISISKSRSSSRRGRFYGSTLKDYFCARPVFVCEKYDGTNVGKDEENNMYGRRQMIAGGKGALYQKTPLAAVEQLDTQKMKDDLFAEIGATEFQKNCFKMVVYGELMCNKGLFDYETRDLSEGWFPFGLIIQHLADEQSASTVLSGASMVQVHDVKAKLVEAGYACTATCEDADDDTGHQPAQIKVTMCSKLRSLVTCSGGGLTPAVCQDEGELESMAAMVEQQKKWMISCKGEGIVVSIPRTALGTANAVVRKWKSASEPQGSNEKIITSTLENVAPLSGACVDEGIITMLQTLLDVATATPPEGQNAKKAGQKVKQPKAARALVPNHVEEALVSALTKFDSLEVFFEKGGSGIANIKSLLMDEVVMDMGVNCHPAEKQIRSAIAAHVGRQFGKWKAGAQ
jgi:hypothetical protein